MHDCSLEYAETAADGFSHLPVHLLVINAVCKLLGFL